MGIHGPPRKWVRRNLPLFTAIVGLLAGWGCSKEPQAADQPETNLVFDPVRWDRIVVIGDSHAQSATAWPSQLNCATVSNLSYRGSALAHETVVAPLTKRIDAQRVIIGPNDLVIVSMGSNDLGQWSTDEMKAAYEKVHDVIAATGSDQRWTTIPPLSEDWPFPALYEDAVDSRERWNEFILTTPGAIDLGGALGDSLEPDEDLGDHVHLSRSAEDRISEVATAEICGT